MATFKNSTAAVKFKLKYLDDQEGNSQGTYTYSKIKTTALNTNIYDTAEAFASLQAKPTLEVYKILDRDLYYE